MTDQCKKVYLSTFPRQHIGEQMKAQRHLTEEVLFLERKQLNPKGK